MRETGIKHCGGMWLTGVCLSSSVVGSVSGVCVCVYVYECVVVCFDRFCWLDGYVERIH